jgi:hypothetical protein
VTTAPHATTNRAGPSPPGAAPDAAAAGSDPTGPHSTSPGRTPIEIALPGRTLLLVAGIPGAGKSTLLAGLPRSAGVVVLDSEAQRAAVRRVVGALPYAWYRPLVHLLHRIAFVAAAMSSVPTVVVHLPATSAGTRAAVARLAAVTGRSAHLLWIHVDPEAARLGQCERGRLVRAASFAEHARRARASVAELQAGPPAGWAGAVVVDRPAARAGLRLATGASGTGARE